MTLFKGLSAFPITPADEQGRVDVEALRRLVRRLVDAKVDSIGLLGSTGSYPYLTRDERRRAIEAAVAEAAGQTPIIVGVGALRTSDAVLMARDARAAGADAGLLAPVSYTPLTDDEVFTHFETVAAASDLPICIYNNPGTTHFSFSEDLIARLSQLPGIGAVKNPAPEAAAAPAAVSALRARVPAGFAVGFSTDWNAAEALIAGGDGWYSVAAGLFPGPCVEIRDAVALGDRQRARQIDAGLAPLWDLFRTFTSLRVIYAAANRLGLCSTQPPRPILPLPEQAQHQVFEVIDRLGLGGS
jgi:4-hydroxy-tetrahydrodipicolinate synthase